MFLIVMLTGIVGFIASFSMLRAGIHAMWLRYPLAVAMAYLGFLSLLWVWLRVKTDDVMGDLGIADAPSGNGGWGGPSDEPFSGGGGHFGGAGQSGSFDPPGDPGLVEALSDADGSGAVSATADVASGLDLEELAVILAVIAALVGALWAAVTVVSTAPTLFAELLLDGALASGLYRRLRRVEGDHWLGTAVRRTAWRFLGVAVLFSLVGVTLQALAPGARSIGQVFMK